MIFYLLLMNYIVGMNRAAFERAWRSRDLVIMLGVSGLLATSTHLLVRLSMYGIFQNVESYASYEHASINFIVMALLMGLRQ